jgi:hypothetical protein
MRFFGSFSKLIGTVCLLAFVSPTFAQSKFQLGVRGGVNLSSLSMGNFMPTRYDQNGNPYLGFDGQEIRDNLRESFDSRTGFSGGVYARFGKNLYIQPEVLVSSKGGSFDIIRNQANQTITEQVNVRFSSIDVPILVGLKGGPFRINAGPMASFRIGDNQRIRDAFQYYTSGTLDDALSQAVYGYQLGAGLDILGVSIDVRREGMLSDLASFRVQQAGGSTQVRQKLNSWQVTLAFKLI